MDHVKCWIKIGMEIMLNKIWLNVKNGNLILPSFHLRLQLILALFVASNI